jgi:hypothetical protein
MSAIRSQIRSLPVTGLVMEFKGENVSRCPIEEVDGSSAARKSNIANPFAQHCTIAAALSDGRRRASLPKGMMTPKLHIKSMFQQILDGSTH